MIWPNSPAAEFSPGFAVGRGLAAEFATRPLACVFGINSASIIDINTLSRYIGADPACARAATASASNNCPRRRERHASQAGSHRRCLPPRERRAVRGNDNDCTLIAALNRASLSSGLQEPLFALQGERGGRVRWASATARDAPTLPRPSPPGGGEGDDKGRVRPGGERVSLRETAPTNFRKDGP